MKKRSQGISVEKPSKVLGKRKELNKIDIKFKELFKFLAKGVTSFVAQKPDLAINSLVDAVCAVEVEKDEGQLAWFLINRSIIRAIAMMVEDNNLIILEATKGFQSLANEAELTEENLLEIVDKLDYAVDAKDITIDDKFFANPKDFSLLEDFKAPLIQWFQTFGLNSAQSESICGRFPSYFVFALNEEWREKHEDYKLILNKIDTPVKNATKIEESWNLYNSLLKKRVDEPMFEEAFSLKQIYIPLRAYYEEKQDKGSQEDLEYISQYRDLRGEKVRRTAFYLSDELAKWLKDSDKNDGIRIISGGPGYGKSSFAKIFASEFVDKIERRVLFIPLHLFKFERDLLDAFKIFQTTKYFPTHNLFDGDNAERRLLLIFDGLDELAMQGKVGKEATQNFVKEVQRQVTLFNHDEARLKVIICGRDIAVQESKNEVDRKTKIFHILPYYLSEAQQMQYEDNKKILTDDQRNHWWKNYGKVIGEDFQSIPEELTKPKLTEITALPLLNYLVALSYTKGKINFKIQDNLNVVYQDLLDSVHKRTWETSQHKSIQGIERKDFFNVLEEIGLAAWHGEGRNVSLKEIEEHCRRSGLHKLLDKFTETAKDGVSSLLLAFYFRKSGNRDLEGNDSFEFTHKSFGEYLTAKRIIRGIIKINKELRERDKDYQSGWDEVEGLVYWVELCGKTEFDDYLIGFLRDEVSLQRKETVAEWQETLSKLINHVLRQGTPMEKLITEKRLTFKEEMRQARNAEESLLVVLSACAVVTKEISSVLFPNPFSLSDWLRRLNSKTAMRSLCYLNLKGAILEGVILKKANLTGANLSLADLTRTDLSDANLIGTNLTGANFSDANLARAIINGANLKDANLFQAYLEGASVFMSNLENANLERAILRGIDFIKGNLSGANLKKTRLEKAKLIETNLTETNLTEANLSGANLSNAYTESADFRYSVLYGAIWVNKMRIVDKINQTNWRMDDGRILSFRGKEFTIVSN